MCTRCVHVHLPEKRAKEGCFLQDEVIIDELSAHSFEDVLNVGYIMEQDSRGTTCEMEGRAGKKFR